MQLKNHTPGTGGTSIFVDGFHVAQDLKDQNKNAYDTLCDLRVCHHADGDHHVSMMSKPGYPTFLKVPDGDELTKIRWNEADRAFVAGLLSQTRPWYDAARYAMYLCNDLRIYTNYAVNFNV